MKIYRIAINPEIINAILPPPFQFPIFDNKLVYITIRPIENVTDITPDTDSASVPININKERSEGNTRPKVTVIKIK